MKTQDVKGIFGDIGERIIANLKSSQGFIIELSLDPYDTKKDLRVNGLAAEIKTQAPYITKQLFTFAANQEYKIKNADLVYFIASPTKFGTIPFSWMGNIYESIEPNKLTILMSQAQQGKQMRAVHKNDPYLHLIHTIKDPKTLDLLRQYSSSES